MSQAPSAAWQPSCAEAETNECSFREGGKLNVPASLVGPACTPVSQRSSKETVVNEISIALLSLLDEKTRTKGKCVFL